VLQALIGEMRRTRGEVSLWPVRVKYCYSLPEHGVSPSFQVAFGGTISYAPQTPWIRNATLRQNVLFGQPDNEDRFREVIRACSLEHDLEVLPNGENTEIGEKGINLSGMLTVFIIIMLW
jgi:ATP-binding cassette, subfamily C (CFTR/MRP), member 1